MHQISFQSDSGLCTVQFEPGSIILIAGPNGVGKSALLVTMYRSLPQGIATYLPGHRQIYFNNGWDTVGQTFAQLTQNLFHNQEVFNRFKSAWAEDQFKSLVRRVLNAEAAYNRNFREQHAKGLHADREASLVRRSPLDTLNSVFEGARLPVRFHVTDDGISAERNGEKYNIDAMSDGERAALFLTSAIITQEDNSVVMIDEPEKHLHPSITSLLIESCIRAKPKVSIVMSSHDVLLIERLSPTQVIHIRNSRVINPNPETRVFDAKIIEDIASVPEDLRAELLGSRSAKLFVEGDLGSADLALYSHVYDEVKVSPRGGHEKVQEAVNALRDLVDVHWISPFGLIDGDGRGEDEKAALAGKGIFCLPCPAIENVFFFEEMIDCFIEASEAFAGGASKDDRISALAKCCAEIAERERLEIISKRTSWLLSRALSNEKRSAKQIKSGETSDIHINVEEIKQSVEAEVDDIISSNDWRRILQELPIKNTALPNAAAKALGAQSFPEYRSVVARQMDIRSSCGNVAISALRSRLPKLA